MRTAVKVQLALQGGGARLYALVAALESLAKLEDGGSLHVTRIAGTSAGAIAGGLYAAGVRPDVLRTYLGHADIRPVLRPAMWPFDTKKAWLARVVRGKAAGSEEAASKLIETVMSTNQIPPTTTLDDVFGRTGRRLAIVATDAKGRKPEVYTTEHNGGARLIDVLMHSAALPFFFRSVPSSAQPLILDGGLCMNLPTDCLLPHVKQDGRVVAVTFRDKPAEQPDSVLALGALLLDIAMNASVLRSRSAPGVTALELDTGTMSTLDFTIAQRACRDMSTDYVLAKDQAARFFDTYAKASDGQVVGSDFWDTSSQAMDTVFRLYEARDAKLAFKHFRRVFHVTLEKPDDKDCPTLIRQELEFLPSKQGIAMMAPHLSVGSPVDIEAVWVHIEESGGSGKPVPFDLLPFRRPIPANEHGEGKYAYGMLIVFAPVLDDTTRRTAIIEYWGKGLMKDLADPSKKREEVMSRSLRAEGPIDEYEIAVIAPSGSLRGVTAAAGAGFATLKPATRRPAVPLKYDAYAFVGQDVAAAQIAGVFVERV